MEKWENIVGYEGKYQISNLGRVKSLKDRYRYRERILKPSTNKRGYKKVVLVKVGEKRKTFLVHRLVAEAFIPNPNNYSEVNHKDENPSNNNVDNLEWCTRKYNINYGTAIERATEKRKGYKHSEETKLKISKNHADVSGKFNPRAKSVVCIELNKQYDTIIDASRDLNINNSDIGKCCRGKLKTAGGYHWKYAS